MRISTIGYILKQGIKNIWRNLMFSLASIATMGACIFLFGLFFSIVVNFQYIIKGAEEGVSITVYFNEDIEQSRIDQIGLAIKDRPEVAQANFVSADEALALFIEDYLDGKAEYAEGFKDNPLANSSHYEVFVNKIENQTELVKYIEGLEGVRSVNQSVIAIKTLSSFNKLIGYISLSIIAILLVVAIFLISNTVTIGINIRREEIGIMKLIGATDYFVRAPFLVEGVLIGLVGAAIPMVALYYMYDNVVKYILEKFQILNNILQFLPAKEVFSSLLPVGLLLGMGIGLIGSVITIRKHLKV